MEMISVQVPRDSALAKGKITSVRRQNIGLSIAAVAVAPLIAFALLWAALLGMLGVIWLGNALGIL
jgi:hypothetical protein